MSNELKLKIMPDAMISSSQIRDHQCL